MRVRLLPHLLVLGTLLSVAGCHVDVQKDQYGEDKNVRVETPLGGLNVRSNQTTAADLGLPVYPGAQLTTDREGDRSADVNMGFGPWQLRVEVVTYQSSDPQSKVIPFYKKALGRFGDVITCQGNQPQGSPSVTSEGLTCNQDKDKVDVNGVHIDDGDDSFTLRAGSKRHQHIFALRTSGEGTRFALIELEMPQDSSNSSGSSD